MEQAFDAEELRGVLHTPEKATGHGLALTPGAGSDSSAPLLVSLSRAFCDAGLLVLRYDLPFRVARAAPTSPAVQARDREGVARAVQALRQRVKGHIFAGGYAAGYYSYLWAELLSADAFGAFEEHAGENGSVIDRATGDRFRREFLAVGASRPALESFIAFRGRKPQPEALLRSHGLT